MTDKTNDTMQIFSEALERQSAEERTSYLNQVCGQDTGQLNKIKALLQAYDEAEDVPDGPLVAVGPTLEHRVSAERPGSMIGRYKLLEKIGVGGFGVVWAAEQRNPVKRRVALKIIKLGMDTKQVVARFEAERQALALMDHPNIAKVLDGGGTETGRPYFVMELVRGIPIIEYCDQQTLSTHSRLDLFIKICHAIQHAHQKGIIHRDIKPSNILITQHDGVPVPKVIDFGIAKATQQELTDKTVYTQFQQFIGTPAYMSPEQAQMSGLDMDTRSDIYSLGVLLYELLTGTTPFDSDELLQSGLDAMRKIIREREPHRPSNKLATLSDEDRTSTALRHATESPRLISNLRGDLDWIVMKCLEKDRRRRYDTANALVMDLQCHLKNEPVLARPPSRMYRMQKAWQRNRVVYSALIVVLLSLLIGITLSLWQTRSVIRAHREAEVYLAQAVASERDATQARNRAVQTALDLQQQTYVADIGLAHQAVLEGNLARARLLLNRQRPKPNEEDLRGFEWRYLWLRSQSNYVGSLGSYQGFFNALALSPDGQFVALNRPNPSRLEIVHLPSETVIKSFATEGDVCPLRFSFTGKVLVGECNKQLIRWDTRTWTQHAPMPLRFPLAFGQTDGKEILVAYWNDTLSIWDTDAWNQLGTLPADPARGPLVNEDFRPIWQMSNALSVSRQDQVVFLAGMKGLRRWELGKREELPPFNVGLSMCVTTSEQGHLAAANLNGSVHIIDAASGQIADSFASNLGWPTGLKFNRDGSRLVSANSDRQMIVYDTQNHSILDRLLGHQSEIWAMDSSADGQIAVSGAAHGGRILTWKLDGSGRDALHAKGVVGVHVLADDRVMVNRVGAVDYELFDVKAGEFSPAGAHRFYRTLGNSGSSEGGFAPVATQAAHSQLAAFRAFVYGGQAPIATSPDGLRLLRLEEDGVAIWNIYTATIEKRLFHPSGRIRKASYSADGRWLATAGEWSEVILWDTETWDSQVLCRDPVTVFAISFSQHAQRIAISGEQGLMAVYAYQDKDVSELFRPKVVDMDVYSAALSRDGRWFAAGSGDNLIRVWDLDSLSPVAVLDGHVTGVFSLSFSEDDCTLASAGENEVNLWHTSTWQEMMRVYATAPFTQFSASGRFLAGKMQGDFLWHAPTLEEIELLDTRTNQ